MFFAIFRLQSEERLSFFYEDVKEAGQMSVVLDGKIAEQKKTASGISIVLDDVFFLNDRGGGRKERLQEKVMVYDVDCPYFIGERIQIEGSFLFKRSRQTLGNFILIFITEREVFMAVSFARK